MTEGTNSPFSRGQRVVCVDADGGNASDFIKKGAIYVVRHSLSNYAEVIGLCHWVEPDDRLKVVWLEEIVRGQVVCCKGNFEPPFAARRFRPVIASARPTFRCSPRFCSLTRRER